MNFMKINKMLVLILTFFLTHASNQQNKNKKKVEIFYGSSQTKIYEEDEVPFGTNNPNAFDHRVSEAIKAQDLNIKKVEFKIDIWMDGFSRNDTRDPVKGRLTLNNIEYKSSYIPQNFISLQIYQEQKQISVPLHDFYGYKFIIIEEIQNILNQKEIDKKIEITNPIDIVFDNEGGKSIYNRSLHNESEHHISKYKIAWLKNHTYYNFCDSKNNVLVLTQLDEVVVKKQVKNVVTTNEKTKNENEGAETKIDNKNNNIMFKIGGFIFVIAAIGFIGYLIKTGKFALGGNKIVKN